MMKTLIVILFLALFLALENLFPFFEKRKFKSQIKHDVKNIIIGLINVVVVALFFTFLWAKVSVSSFAINFGILNQLNLSYVVSLILAIILFDIWMYWWHRFNHKLPFLWKFHKMHHTDTLMDSTSAFRFHMVEIIFSSIGRLAIIPILGISLSQLLIYELILLPIIIFHHSNINLPKRIDYLLRLFIVTPNHHRIHHSKIQRETDSNYSSIFSFWDKLFVSYNKRKDYRKISLGLDVKEQSFVEMIKDPWR